MNPFDAVHISSPTQSRSTHAAAQNGRPRARNPLESLSSFVNSLEIKTVGSRLRKSVSQRFGDRAFPTGHHDNDHDNDYETEIDENSENSENDATLDDEDLLMSPTQRSRTSGSVSALASVPVPASASEVYVQDTHHEHGHAFASNEHLPSTSIRTFSVPHDNLPRIDHAEMQKIVRGEYAASFDEIVVVDCRFPYEYAGGHIAGAINLSSQQALEEHFFWRTAGEICHPQTDQRNDNKTENQREATKLLVFHCEYSVLRGPALAAHLRKTDRQLNAHRYPHLHFPDVVVLEHGYKGFFDHCRNLCEPQQYVPMNALPYRRTCEIEMGRVMQASKLTRAKSATQFPPRLGLAHSRSASLTALLTSTSLSTSTDVATVSSTASSTTLAPRSRRSLKIKKRERERAVPRPQFAQSFAGALESPTRGSPVLSVFDSDDLVPPAALFRHYSRGSAASLRSANSSSSSLSLSLSSSLSPTVSASASCDSLSETASPFYEPADCGRDGGRDGEHSGDSEPELAGFTPRPALHRPGFRSFKHEGTSPVLSSPLSSSLSFGPGSVATDVIREAPLEFSLPPKGKRHPRLVRHNQHGHS